MFVAVAAAALFGGVAFAADRSPAAASDSPDRARCVAAAKRPCHVLIHVTSGPENPTKAALAFLVAKTAVEQRDRVTVFLAGDAVQLIRTPVLDNLAGLGTGSLRQSFDAFVTGGGLIYLSGGSSAARGVTAADLAGKPAEFATPAKLVELAKANDVLFTY